MREAQGEGLARLPQRPVLTVRSLERILRRIFLPWTIRSLEHSFPRPNLMWNFPGLRP